MGPTWGYTVSLTDGPFCKEGQQVLLDVRVDEFFRVYVSLSLSVLVVESGRVYGLGFRV